MPPLWAENTFMPAKLIICCAGRPAINGHKRRSFLWMDKHGCFVHNGVELDEVAFNACSQEVMSKNQDLRCFAKVVDSDGVATADPRIAHLEAKLIENQTRIYTLQASLISARNSAPASDITLEQALAVVESLAPDKIKKKPGRKPDAIAEI